MTEDLYSMLFVTTFKSEYIYHSEQTADEDEAEDARKVEEMFAAPEEEQNKHIKAIKQLNVERCRYSE